MSADVRAAVAAGDLSFFSVETLSDYVVRQRWFGSKAREVAQLNVLEVVPLRTEAPLLVIALLETRFQPGTHQVYQALLGLRPADEGWEQGVICESEGWTVYDALADPELAGELHRLLARSATCRRASRPVASSSSRASHCRAAAPDHARPMGAEQSNSSVVYDDRLVLKAYRRVEAGINPELELLRFLTEHGFPNVAPLAGWYHLEGRLMDATLGVLQDYVGEGRDGWELALDALASDPDGFLDAIRRLGEVTGEMHTALGSDPGDPASPPEEPSAETLSLLTATVDEEIEQIFLDIPEEGPTAPIAGRGEEVREQLRLLSHIGAPAASSATTATTTWARPCWPATTGSSSTSRASRARAARAPAQALAAARRRRDAALLRLRRLGLGASCAGSTRPRTGSSGRARSSWTGT